MSKQQHNYRFNREISFSVHQGQIIGPFSIYAKANQIILVKKCMLFADDSVILVAHSNTTNRGTLLQNGLLHLNE